MRLENKQDLEFMEEVKKASSKQLETLLKFQCCEVWRRILVIRELNRRKSDERVSDERV